jgi:hypothetical protein
MDQTQAQSHCIGSTIRPQSTTTTSSASAISRSAAGTDCQTAILASTDISDFAPFWL